VSDRRSVARQSTVRKSEVLVRKSVVLVRKSEAAPPMRQSEVQAPSFERTTEVISPIDTSYAPAPEPAAPEAYPDPVPSPVAEQYYYEPSVVPAPPPQTKAFKPKVLSTGVGIKGGKKAKPKRSSVAGVLRSCLPEWLRKFLQSCCSCCSLFKTPEPTDGAQQDDRDTVASASPSMASFSAFFGQSGGDTQNPMANPMDGGQERALPWPWERHLDPSSGSAYYYNPETQATSWEIPTS